jgi:hypothetical protein
MLPWGVELSGRIDEHVFESEALRGNPLGDPHERPLWVYVPPGYDASDERYPAVYVIQGYTGHVSMWRNRAAFRQPFPELADAVITRGDCRPVLLVLVDAWTAYGGSQFLDSPATGNYHTYLCDEVVPWVDARYRTVPDRDHRAIAGKSSGGYGAMVTPMLRPDLFGAFATHAGDALFDVCYRSDFPKLARMLKAYQASYDEFLVDFRSRIPLTKDDDLELIEMYGYAAAYSADGDGTVRIPFDPQTGDALPDLWERWLAWDPVVMATKPPYAEALRSMRAIWIDAGSRDEYYLDFGATAFRRALGVAGVPEERVFFELFDGKHGMIEYRYPLALAWLADRLAD